MHTHRKKPLYLLASTVALFGLTGCGFLTGSGGSSSGTSGGEASADTDNAVECTDQTIRLATIRADSDPVTLGANAFAEAAAEASDGGVTVEVFPNSQLGDANDIFSSMSQGQEVDMFLNSLSLYPTLDGAEAFTVTSVPFMWESYDQLEATLKSEEFQELFEEAAQASGVRVFEIKGDTEPRALSANRAIHNADEMAGLKLRIADAPMPQKFATTVGAQPQVVPFSDLYLSLRQGVVDAQENGAITMINQSLTEVQSHYMPIDYIRDIQGFYISEQVWAGMCETHQDALMQAADSAGDLITEEVHKQMDEAMETIDAAIEIVDVDVESFRTAMEGVFEEFDGDLWPEGTLEMTQRLAAENS